MNYIGIIPSRYASTRFPGKPLADIAGKTMIERVYKQARKALDIVLVATDDERIRSEVERFGGRVVMTSEKHKSGTDRCYEAFCKYNQNCNFKHNETVVINIQGDEPFIQPSQIELLKQLFAAQNTEIATLARPYKSTDSIEDLQNPNTPKVAISSVNNEALYFSRSIIPYFRGEELQKWLLNQGENPLYYRHIGMYAYRADVLQKITALPQSKLEKAESLEQLRWLENGYRIRVAITDVVSQGIDTPQDLENAIKLLKGTSKNSPFLD